MNSPLPSVFAGLAFGASMGLFFGLRTGEPSIGLTTAVIGGLGFGLAMRTFSNLAANSSVLEPQGQPAGFDDGEVVTKQGLANHFKGLEGVGGKLFLTNRRLRFRSHAMNVQNHDESYPLEDITAVEATKTLGLVPNGLLVHLREGRRERFVVSGRADWVQRLRSVIGQAR